MNAVVPPRIQRLLIRIIGACMLVVGLLSAFVAPLEVQTLTFFSEGGRFAYPGFGFGSLMFGNIVVQVFGYYLIAMVFIPLGYGQIRLRQWSIKLMLTLLVIWLILGFPLTLLAFLILFATKEITNTALPLVTIAFFLIYPILPLLVIAFYRRVDARSVLDNGVVVWVKETPLVVLVISALMIFFGLALHVPLLFNGIFPFFGQYLFSFEGILLLDLSFMVLLLLTWGILNQRRWAWWASLLYFAMMIISATVTMLVQPASLIIESQNFAPFEFAILKNVPLHGFHLVILFVTPLIATLLLLFVSHRYFDVHHEET